MSEVTIEAVSILLLLLSALAMLASVALVRSLSAAREANVEISRIRRLELAQALKKQLADGPTAYSHDAVPGAPEISQDQVDEFRQHMAATYPESDLLRRMAAPLPLAPRPVYQSGDLVLEREIEGRWVPFSLRPPDHHDVGEIRAGLHPGVRIQGDADGVG